MGNLEKGLRKAGVPGAKKHLFLCIGPDCCKSKIGDLTWDYVKKRTAQCGVEVMRTKAGCFRICTDGPIMVVYPEGIWYGQVTPIRFERILQQHVVGGEPVREWVIAENALAAAPAL